MFYFSRQSNTRKDGDVVGCAVAKFEGFQLVLQFIADVEVIYRASDFPSCFIKSIGSVGHSQIYLIHPTLGYRLP